MSGLSDQERFDRLRLARTDQVGPVAFSGLLERFGSASRALSALPDLARRAGRTAPLRPASAKEMESELFAGKAVGARLFVLGDRDFPPQLAALDPPPPVFWCRGWPELLHRPSVAIVGARSASVSAQKLAQDLARDLGAAGFAIVSGMARGVDAAAHRGSLQQGSIAVLAGGVDDVYPPEHEALYQQIIDQGACVSENPMGRRATARDFPRRNRIISGLSLGVVVVEAELRSGSLITARLAAEQGRDVFAMPGSPLDPRCRGSNDLLRHGAILCEGASDVLSVLTAEPRLSEPETHPFATRLDEAELAAAAERLREEAYNLLSPSPVARDLVVQHLGAPAAAVFAALVELSLAGRAELMPGGMVCRAPQSGSDISDASPTWRQRD